MIDGLVLGTLTISNDGHATFVADGADVDKLGHDAIKTYGFTYETQSIMGNLATADVVLTIDGQNDQPLALMCRHLWVKMMLPTHEIAVLLATG